MVRCKKRRYRDELDAKIALSVIDMRSRRRKRAGERRAYLCPLCGGWHLTSRP